MRLLYRSIIPLLIPDHSLKNHNKKSSDSLSEILITDDISRLDGQMASGDRTA
jgi:hypothetical protein